MLNSNLAMCTTWAQTAGNVWATAVPKSLTFMPECINTYLSSRYPAAVHCFAHKVIAEFSSVIGQVIPIIHSAYKEPKTFKLNNTNTKACGEQS